MASIISAFHEKAPGKKKFRSMILAIWLLALTACDLASVPTPPTEPLRPQTMGARQSDVQNAIFTYAGPDAKRAPQAARQGGNAKCCRLQV